MHLLSLYFETTAKIPEVEFGGKFGYLRANMHKSTRKEDA
jgi:hypothetical protein